MIFKDEELKNFSAEHLRYEFEMLFGIPKVQLMFVKNSHQPF